jgi:hypothetical protein
MATVVIDRRQQVPAVVQLVDRFGDPVGVNVPSLNVQFSLGDVVLPEIQPDGTIQLHANSVGQTDISVTANGVELPVATVIVVNPPAVSGQLVFGDVSDNTPPVGP